MAAVLAAAAAFLMIAGAVAAAPPLVPCFHIFGDSLVDDGNNNGIMTLARANYPPYGIDFPGGPSGRFTNGKTMVDILTLMLGFKTLVPSYAAAQRSDYLRGLNFASGAAGILDDTGTNLGQHYPMAVQLAHFRAAVAGARNATSLLGRCIFFVGMGSNDYLNNYFMPNLYRTSYDYTPAKYAALLVADYARHLTELYSMGARKIAVVGVGEIGCIPYELARFNGAGASGGRNKICNERINSAIALFNAGAIRMVDMLNAKLPGARLVFVNTYNTSRDIAASAAAYGFAVVDRGCCGVGRNNGQITCLPFQTPCADRKSYLFWDAFHPTEAANYVYARKAFDSASPSDVYPMNIRQLAMAA